MKLYLLLLLFFFTGCAAQRELSSSANTEGISNTEAEVSGDEKTEAPRSKRIYYFQHRVIPKWVFSSEGAFYNDLKTGNIQRILEAAHDIVDAQYAVQLEITPIENEDAILIVFPKPTSPPNCYFALIEKTSESYNYYTYESTIPLAAEEAIAGVVGGWNEEEGHLNFGPRSYTLAADFVNDMLAR